MSHIAAFSAQENVKQYFVSAKPQQENESLFHRISSSFKKAWNTTVAQFQTPGGYKNFAKAPATYLGALGGFVTLTPFQTALKEGSNLLKNGLSIAALPTNIQEFSDAASACKQAFSDPKASSEEKKDAVIQAGWKLNAFVPNIFDGIKFLTDAKIGLLNLSKHTLTWLGGINNASLLAFASDQARRNMCKIADEKTLDSDSPKLVRKTLDRVTYHMLNLATNVSYVALAAFALLSLAFTWVPAWIVAVCSASALTFTFAAIYFKGIKEDPGNRYISNPVGEFLKNQKLPIPTSNVTTA